MIELQTRIVHLKKRFPLTISRGTITGSDNLFISLTNGEVTGWGEMAPGATEGADTAEAGAEMLDRFVEAGGLAGDSIHAIHDAAVRSGMARCALAALDMALWDLRAKEAGMPLHRLLGLGPSAVATSLTVGINPPDTARDRARHASGLGAKALKIKLGAPEGIEADKAMFAAVREAVDGYGDVVLRVDANGGWTPDGARHMMGWLAERGVEYVEQPLPRGAEDALVDLFRDRTLPIFVDESCRIAADIPGFADRVDGVNLKLMKCGGITEALRIVATARAFGLKTMIGCMGESSVSISAGAALSELFDYIDLDSQLNLDPDPATGARFTEGRVVPGAEPGHGGALVDA